MTPASWRAHYMIRGTRKFAGTEINPSIAGGRSDLVVRPLLGINVHFLLGIAAGVRHEKQRMGVSLTDLRDE